MSKIKRNDLCPCGSGIKYKNCCGTKELTDKITSDIKNHFNSLWSYEEVNEMSTTEIISKLESLGIPFDKEKFLGDIEEYDSAQDLSNHWFNIYNVKAIGRDEGFPWFSTWILWERLAPLHMMSREQMVDLIDKGHDFLEKHDSIQACDAWLIVWNAFKYRNKPEFKTLEYLELLYKGDIFALDFCQDLEMELQNAGLDDSTYYEKCISFCKDFCKFFSDEDKLIIFYMRRAIANSLFKLDRIEEANIEFDRLIKDYPTNPWSYIACADAYCMAKNENYKDILRAKKFYEQALLVAEDDEDIDVIMERIDNLDD